MKVGLFGFPHQTLHLKHESISREAFGNGILFALKNLPRRAVGLFTMEDILLPFFISKFAEASKNNILNLAELFHGKNATLIYFNLPTNVIFQIFRHSRK